MTRRGQRSALDLESMISLCGVPRVEVIEAHLTRIAAEMVRPVVRAKRLGLASAGVPVARDAAAGWPARVLPTGARCREDQRRDAAEAIAHRLALAMPIDPDG
jgi:hypothetical protein